MARARRLLQEAVPMPASPIGRADTPLLISRHRGSDRRVGYARLGVRPGSHGRQNLGVKGGFAAAQRSGPLTPWFASKEEHPCDPGRTVDRLRPVESVIIT